MSTAKPGEAGEAARVVATHWPAWIAAGLRARRKTLARDRSMLLCRAGVPDAVKRRGAEAYDAIIAEIDTQIRDVAFGWEHAAATGDRRDDSAARAAGGGDV